MLTFFQFSCLRRSIPLFSPPHLLSSSDSQLETSSSSIISSWVLVSLLISLRVTTAHEMNARIPLAIAARNAITITLPTALAIAATFDISVPFESSIERFGFYLLSLNFFLSSASCFARIQCASGNSVATRLSSRRSRRTRSFIRAVNAQWPTSTTPEYSENCFQELARLNHAPSVPVAT